MTIDGGTETPGIPDRAFAVPGGPIGVSIGRHVFDPPPEAALFGPTSRALLWRRHDRHRHQRTRLGRLFAGSAGSVADRIVPLGDMLDLAKVVGLVAVLGEPIARIR